jgi:uncharacterized protein HemX
MSDFALPAVPERLVFYKRPLARWLGLSVVLSALIVAFVFVYAIQSGRLNDTRTALHSLQRQTEANSAAIKATKQTDLSNLTAKLATQNKQIGLLAGCLPEIQSEINGLNISTEWQAYGGSTYLTSAFLQNNTIVSRVCQPVFNGK